MRITAAKLSKILVYACLAILTTSTCLMLYWLYQPTNVLEFKKDPIPLRTIRDHPSANGVVILEVDYCKNINAQGRVRTSFVSESREVFLPQSEDKQPKQCVDTELPILLPKDIPPDTYRVKFRVDYKINPIRHDIEEIYSKPFEVVT